MSFFGNFFGGNKGIIDKDNNITKDTNIPKSNSIQVFINGNKYIRRGMFGELGYGYSYDYYNTVSILKNCIDRITQTTRYVLLKEKDTENSKVIKMLYDTGIKSTIQALMKSFLICGDAYIRVASVPFQTTTQGLTFVDPTVIGEILQIKNAFGVVVRSFKIDNTRYLYDYDAKAFVADNNMSWIYVVQNEQTMTPFGINPLASLVAKLDVLIGIEEHNASLVHKGIKLSGILMTEDDNDQSDIDEALSKHKGSNNAGNIMTIPNGRSFVDLSVNTADGDYLNLSTNYEKSIVKTYGIPLPMMFDEAQKFSNLAEAIEQFIELAFLSPWDELIDGIEFVVKKMYPAFNGFEYDIEQESVTLMMQRMEIMKSANETGAYTINELRKIGRLEALSEGADVIINKQGVPVAFNDLKDDITPL